MTKVGKGPGTGTLDCNCTKSTALSYWCSPYWCRLLCSIITKQTSWTLLTPSLTSLIYPKVATSFNITYYLRSLITNDKIFCHSDIYCDITNRDRNIFNDTSSPGDPCHSCFKFVIKHQTHQAFLCNFTLLFFFKRLNNNISSLN
jgi:hypothetical protein